LEIDQKLSYSDEPFEDGSYMIVKEIIKDGSCLYSAINYAMYQEEGNGFALRELVHDLLQTEEYTDFKNCIDQPIEEYFRNLIVDLVWGGELEISILAKYFKTQIHVIYMKELNFHSYGPENSFRAIFLLYTGSHYNLIVRNFLDGEKDMDVTLFQIGSRNNQDKAASAAQNFTLKCEYEEFVEFFCDTCKRSFQGKSLSSLHHQETGHNVISKC
jgi:ubiquitin thioesterase OTU1